MQTAPMPLVQDLVLVGGGHTHALILRMWGMDPLPGTRLTLINPDPIAPYTGMLPGFVAGHYTRNQIMIDLAALARFAGARLILGRVSALDPVAREVTLEGGRRIAFDVASVNVGITSDLPDLAGFARYGHPAKPLGDFAQAWHAFVARRLPHVAVIGGGVAGVELALAAAHRLQSNGIPPGVTLLERGPAILPLMGRRARALLTTALNRAGVRILTQTQPTHVSDGALHLAGGQTLVSDFTLSAAGARAPAWFANTGLTLANGYLAVSASLQTSHAGIFAAGDCADMTDSPRPKAGVFAVRQAPVLLHNLRHALSGQGSLQRYRPQRDYLKLVSLGPKSALAEKFGFALSGPRLWALKDRIDTAFMARLTDLPAMSAPAVPALHSVGLAEAVGAKPACGGCGAKVGGAALSQVLSQIAAPRHPDVLSGPGDDAAVLRSGDGVQVITTDHLRSVTDDPAQMARIAAVHALGDIWAMGAAPQGALVQIILPRMSPKLQARTLAEIMSAASDVFGAAGADILGGHTSVGAELTIGFTVTGLTRQPIAKAGAKPGDALILTKSVGSGTVLAAAMAQVRVPGLLLGEVVAATEAAMIRPMGAASAILAPVAHAMTDVTGFGLAGHLSEILQASGCQATISLAALPLLPGAEMLAGAGVASTLAPDNRAVLTGRITFAECARAALLFDPQTCGGLLAAVPANVVDSVLAALRGQGDDAALIGTISAGAPHLTVVA